MKKSLAKASNNFLSFFQKNHTQIVVTIIFLLPTIILILTTLITLYFFQEASRSFILNFADNLYEDQISNSKIFNKAVVFQLNDQIQKVSWQINLTNQLYQKYLLNKVKKNSNFTAAILNIQRAFDKQENPIILDIFQKYILSTSN
ncbi:hypothetical protein ABPG73_015212, partial [Tetrahymena malaccensis]